MIIVISAGTTPTPAGSVDIEMRIVLRGATGDEMEQLGEKIRQVLNDVRPMADVKAFIVDAPVEI